LKAKEGCIAADFMLKREARQKFEAYLDVLMMKQFGI